MYKFYNPNPHGKFVGDCVVRAICKIEDSDWDSIYLAICMIGFEKKGMPADNNIWGGIVLPYIFYGGENGTNFYSRSKCDNWNTYRKSVVEIP